MWFYIIIIIVVVTIAIAIFGKKSDKGKLPYVKKSYFLTKAKVDFLEC